jgi:hypothetical protein
MNTATLNGAHAPLTVDEARKLVGTFVRIKRHGGERLHRAKLIRMEGRRAIVQRGGAQKEEVAVSSVYPPEPEAFEPVASDETPKPPAPEPQVISPPPPLTIPVRGGLVLQPSKKPVSQVSDFAELGLMLEAAKAEVQEAHELGKEAEARVSEIEARFQQVFTQASEVLKSMRGAARFLPSEAGARRAGTVRDYLLRVLDPDVIYRSEVAAEKVIQAGWQGRAEGETTMAQASGAISICVSKYTQEFRRVAKGRFLVIGPKTAGPGWCNGSAPGNYKSL